MLGLLFLLILIRFFLFGVVVVSLGMFDFVLSVIGIIFMLFFFKIFVWFVMLLRELFDFLLVIIIRIFLVLGWFCVLKKFFVFERVWFNSVLEFFCIEFIKCFNVLLFEKVVLNEILVMGIFLNVMIVYWILDVLYWLIIFWMIFFICWKLLFFFKVLVLRVKRRFNFGMVGGFKMVRI